MYRKDALSLLGSNMNANFDDNFNKTKETLVKIDDEYLQLQEQLSLQKELKFELVLQFQDNKNMTICYNHINDLVKMHQLDEYRKRRALEDFNYWTSNIPTYTHLLIQQSEFWKFNSISEDQFL